MHGVNGFIHKFTHLVEMNSTVQPKNNARARTSFCVRKKKFFLRLIAGRLSLSPGNRKNFFAVGCSNRKNFFAVGCSNRKNFFAVLCVTL